MWEKKKDISAYEKRERVRCFVKGMKTLDISLGHHAVKKIVCDDPESIRFVQIKAY